MAPVLSSFSPAETEIRPAEVTTDEERVLFSRNEAGGESEERENERWNLMGDESREIWKWGFGGEARRERDDMPICH